MQKHLSVQQILKTIQLELTRYCNEQNTCVKTKISTNNIKQ